MKTDEVFIFLNQEFLRTSTLKNNSLSESSPYFVWKFCECRIIRPTNLTDPRTDGQSGRKRAREIESEREIERERERERERENTLFVSLIFLVIIPVILMSDVFPQKKQPLK